MDPLFTYLNQIPGVMAVQGYVDDTTIAGDGQDLDWIGRVDSCYRALQTAGFVIDPHACYFAGIVINNRSFPHNNWMPCGPQLPGRAEKVSPKQR